MKKTFACLVIVSLISVFMMSAATFPSSEGKLFNDQAFTFPDDLVSDKHIVIALTLSSSRKNGEVQQEAFITWQQELAGLITEEMIYHIVVIDGAPFFVRGAIRSGLAQSYETIIDPAQGGVLFLSKAQRLASQAGIPIDGEPTLVVLSAQNTIAGFVKGSYTQQRKEQLLELLEQ